MSSNPKSIPSLCRNRNMYPGPLYALYTSWIRRLIYFYILVLFNWSCAVISCRAPVVHCRVTLSLRDQPDQQTRCGSCRWSTSFCSCLVVTGPTLNRRSQWRTSDRPKPPPLYPCVLCVCMCVYVPLSCNLPMLFSHFSLGPSTPGAHEWHFSPHTNQAVAM